MKWPFRKSEHRAQNYAEQLAQAYHAIAAGASVSSAQTAAGEFAVGLISRSLAVAEVTGADISPSTLAAIGRGLAVNGNAVFDLEADPVGGLSFLPAASYDITGSPDPSSWTYSLELPGPSRNQTVVRSGADVVHCRINALPQTPWQGRSALIASGYSGKLLASIEQRTAEEATSRIGHLLAIPPLNAESKTAMNADLASRSGGYHVVENSGGNYPRQTTQGGNSADFRTVRVGAEFPDSNIALRRDVASDVVSSFGIPSALYNGSEGSQVREAWRQFGVSMDAYTEIVAEELSTKLERTITISNRRLASIDIASRARALGIFIQNGMAMAAALEQSGLGE